MINAQSVHGAMGLIKGIVHRTPVLQSRTLDERVGGRVHLKMESLQVSGSFKFRGAFHALSRRLMEARTRGVVTGSSGNHGGALARAASILGVPVTVVMPEDAAGVKVAAVEGYGARVVRCGFSSAERLARAQELADSEGFLSIPPYDDEDIIAGQGTVAMEALEEVPGMDVFAAPCGGGGLLAGCATWLQAKVPSVEVWGVEPTTGDDTHRSLLAGEPVEIPVPDTIADGMRNVRPGRLTFPIIQHRCRGVVLVDDDAIREAMRFLVTRVKVVAEPTGAAPLAALLRGEIDLDGRTAVLVVSGGNVDPEVLASCLRT
jgi:threonine dehydratase